jgi:hypothetical protein
MARGKAAIEVIFKRRGWNSTRYRYPCEDGGTGTARAWHKEGTGLWIMSCEAGRSFDVSAGTPTTPAGAVKPLYRLTGFEHRDDLEDRCCAAVMVIEFAERIVPLADWPNAGQWDATAELGRRIHQIGLDVTGLTEAQLAEVNAPRKALPEQMQQGFLALARAAPDPGDGADPAILRPLILAVAEQFPQALESDFDRMVEKLLRKDCQKLVESIPLLQRTCQEMFRREVGDRDRALTVEISDEGIACTKAVCNYIYQTYGRFPGGVDAMHLMWFMQAHHLDTDYYDKFFRPGVYGETHAAHVATWHP